MRSVILTGAAGGIGMATLPLLVKAGYVVYAGAIDDWELEEINRIKSLSETDLIIPVLLDTREAAHADTVLRRVESENPELIALILNGGACPVPAPFEHLDLEITRDVFESNVIGNLRLMQRSLKLLKSSQGRIVFISSMWGLIPAHLASSYSAGKHAAEAFCAIIRRELEPLFGIKVIMINPGAVKDTYMIAKHYYGTREVVAEMEGCKPGDLGPDNFDEGRNTKLKQQIQVPDRTYRSLQYGYTKSLIDLLDPKKMKFMATPRDCAEAIMKGVQSTNPRRRYLVGGDVKVLRWFARVRDGRFLDWLFAAAFNARS